MLWVGQGGRDRGVSMGPPVRQKLSGLRCTVVVGHRASARWRGARWRLLQWRGGPCGLQGLRIGVDPEEPLPCRLDARRGARRREFTIRLSLTF